jgi:putative ABC transport system ATP-binding protein
MNVIETSGLIKEFNMGPITQQVLKGIDLRVEAGDFAGIVGPSGSGKTTLLYCLSSLEPLTSGSVFFNGQDIAGYKAADISLLRKKDLGFIFQFYNLIPN